MSRTRRSMPSAADSACRPRAGRSKRGNIPPRLRRSRIAAHLEQAIDLSLRSTDASGQISRVILILQTLSGKRKIYPSLSSLSQPFNTLQSVSWRSLTPATAPRLRNVMRHTPANLCRLLALLEFSYFGNDLGEAIGEAVEETTVSSFGKGAAIHFQNVLSQAQGIEQTSGVGLGRTDGGREP
jgi:hypothetical protein